MLELATQKIVVRCSEEDRKGRSVEIRRVVSISKNPSKVVEAVSKE